VAAGPDPANKCVAAKINASAKRFAAIAKCRAKAVLAGTAVDPGCLEKAEKKCLITNSILSEVSLEPQVEFEEAFVTA